MADQYEKTAVGPLRFLRHFGLQTLLIVIAVVAALLIVVNIYVRPKLEHRIAVGRVFGLGGAVWFEDKSVDGGFENPYTAKTPNLWRNVRSIEIENDAQATILAHELARIPEARDIGFGTGVTDLGLATVCKSHNCGAIETVDLSLSQITSNGISTLNQLPKLRRIAFYSCPVNATGLAELKKLPGLQMLTFAEERRPNANHNRLDDACFSEIGKLTQLETLGFADLNVSDTAARQLHNLKQLKSLSFHRGYMSSSAISELRSALPTTEIGVY